MLGSEVAAVDQIIIAKTDKFQKDVMADVGLQKILSWGLKLLQDLEICPRHQEIKVQEST